MEIVSQAKRQSLEWEKPFVAYAFGKGWVSRIYTGLKELIINSKKKKKKLNQNSDLSKYQVVSSEIIDKRVTL